MKVTRFLSCPGLFVLNLLSVRDHSGYFKASVLTSLTTEGQNGDLSTWPC